MRPRRTGLAAYLYRGRHRRRDHLGHLALSWSLMVLGR